jgi:amidase
VSTFITRFATAAASGVRVAVKDLIDLAGEPTTAGCRALARRGVPAADDAACVAGIRAAEAAGAAVMVGKTNLHELAAGTTGVNPWFGTPVNPLDPSRIPGGSSSGSAVAVGAGQADVALGTDTAGSVRIPSACCGTVGLKTSWGRVSLDGVYPLAPSLDTVGPMARDMAGLVAGMQLLEPGFSVPPGVPTTVGRLRIQADPRIDDAVDRALAAAGMTVVETRLDRWHQAAEACASIILAEAWLSNRALLDAEPDGVSTALRNLLVRHGPGAVAGLDRVRAFQASWRADLRSVFTSVDVLVLPTLVRFPPPLGAAGDGAELVRATAPVNLAGAPALSLPVPARAPLPASLQVVGPPGSEERLVALGRHLEAAVA